MRPLHLLPVIAILASPSLAFAQVDSPVSSDQVTQSSVVQDLPIEPTSRNTSSSRGSATSAEQGNGTFSFSSDRGYQRQGSSGGSPTSARTIAAPSGNDVTIVSPGQQSTQGSGEWKIHLDDSGKMAVEKSSGDTGTGNGSIDVKDDGSFSTDKTTDLSTSSESPETVGTETENSQGSQADTQATETQASQGAVDKPSDCGADPCPDTSSSSVSGLDTPVDQTATNTSSGTVRCQPTVTTAEDMRSFCTTAKELGFLDQLAGDCAGWDNPLTVGVLPSVDRSSCSTDETASTTDNIGQVPQGGSLVPSATTDTVPTGSATANTDSAQQPL